MADAAARRVPVLAALAQPTRLAILSKVAEAGPMGLAAGMLARAVRCPASTLSFHLKELSRTGLLEARPKGRFVHYALRREALEDLARYLAELSGQPVPAAGRKGRAEKGGRRTGAADREQLSMFGD